ncbi:MAG: glycerol-3-phosphate acyltransferase [Oscillospiraceae bacterium]|nr:glycerol-3-phosphate acyltransferase [Oscillospiraceae bacterium]
MKQTGTGNLSASNTILLLGKGYGMLVMVVDIIKVFLACHIGQWIFPDLEIAAYITGFGTILGHVYPFYLHFKGGKGLACYGGMVCYYNVWLLLFYLTGGVLLMILANRSIFLAVLVTVSFPIILLLGTGNFKQFLVVTIASVFLLWVHRKNFGRVKRGEEAPM